MHSYTVSVSTNASGFEHGVDVNLFYNDVTKAYEAYNYVKKNLQDHIDRKNTKETSFCVEDMFGEITFENNRLTRVRIINEVDWRKNVEDVALYEKGMKE